MLHLSDALFLVNFFRIVQIRQPDPNVSIFFLKYGDCSAFPRCFVMVNKMVGPLTNNFIVIGR